MISYKSKAISVIGLGYIGLPTAALLASERYKVNGMDIDQNTVDTINRGQAHIVEPDLDAYVRSAVSTGFLTASTKVVPADVYMICVPTPFYGGAGIPRPNIDFVRAASKSIAPHVKDGDIVILESTSPVGTTELVAEVLADNGVDIEKLFIAYCPERVLPGRIMVELVQNDRVIGGINRQSTQVVADFYRAFVKGVILETDSKTAEMCKLTENSFRDVNIAFANELSMICDKNGVDVWELIDLANHHPRVSVLQPGTGVGGHCIAVDPWFIAASDPENSRLIQQARIVNDLKPHWIVKKLVDVAKSTGLSQPKIACLGLAFKPDIDDLRESPALQVAASLIDMGFDVVCVEPNITSHEFFKLTNFESALQESDIVTILVAHKEFKTESAITKLGEQLTVDCCGIIRSAS